MAAHPEHRTILAVDIESYGMITRTNPARLQLRERLRRLCAAILVHAGADDRFTVQDIGDGYLFFVDPLVHKSRLLSSILAHLNRRLNAGNRRRPPAEQMRLRVALHAGDVLSDPQLSPAEPMHGDATIHTCRLLDSKALRACLKQTQAACALIVSETIYDNIVKHGYGGIDPATFHVVRITEKETHKFAWVHVPSDHDAPIRAGVAAPGRILHPLEPVPHELPPTVVPFIGRYRELAYLRQLLHDYQTASTLIIVLTHGRGGVGKSALALRIAHEVAGAFPDGQLYTDLLATAPDQPPLDPLAAVRRFLSSLGLREDEIPSPLDAAAARYRSLLAGRRVLIVLDNALNSAQLTPLLPGSPSCAVLVTSRSTLDELDGVERIKLAVLDRDDAIDLLSRYAGTDRIARDPAAADAIARYCDDLPLALRIAAARLAARPAWTVRSMAQRLADERRRLDELFRGDMAVRTSLAVSYQALRRDPRATRVDAARAFRLLGLLDGADIGVGVTAALLDVSAEAAEAALEQLTDEYLLDSPTLGRYRFHDLVRLLAREYANADEPADARLAAHLRALRFYLASVQQADRLLRPRQPTPDHQPTPAGRAYLPADHHDALAWLDREYPNLIAAIHQAARLPAIPTSIATTLAHALFTYFTLRSHLTDWEQVSHSVLDAARRDHDLHGQGQADNALGCIAQRRGDHDQAAAHFDQSLTLRRRVGDRTGEAGTLCNLALTRRHQRRHHEAAAHYQDSLTIYRQLGNRLAEGQVLNSLANVYREQNRPKHAVALHRQALAICEQTNDRPGQIHTLYSLGQTCRALGRDHEAVAYYTQDLAIARELGDRQGCAEILRELGHAVEALGRHAEAIEHWQQALTILEQLDPDQAYGDLATDTRTIRDLLGS